MQNEYPIRDNNSICEEISVRYFRNCVPANWIVEKPSNDYGIDLRIEIVNANANSGREFLVQLKSSQREMLCERTSDYVKCIGFKTSTYNYLKNKLPAVMIVKYIKSTNMAYWIWLKDIEVSNRVSRTLTIDIPKSNILSSIDWDEIADYVEEITVGKLSFSRG